MKIFSVYSCHLFLIPSASVRSIPFLSFIEPIFTWNVPLVSLIFLKRSLVFPILLFFLYFFALITEEAFLISPWYSLKLSIQIGISFLSPLPLASLLSKNKQTNKQTKKSFSQNSSSFRLKTLQWVGIGRNYLYIIKSIYDKPTANIILTGVKQKTFPLRSGIK